MAYQGIDKVFHVWYNDYVDFYLYTATAKEKDNETYYIVYLINMHLYWCYGCLFFMQRGSALRA